MGWDYYNMDGEPITREEWFSFISGDFEMTRRVAETTIGDVSVSTVLIGLNHSFGDGPPLIFETMIFGGPHAEFQKRYSTKEEAIEGHARAVDLVRGDK